MSTTKEISSKKSSNLLLIAALSVAYLCFVAIYAHLDLERAYTLKRIVGVSASFFILIPLAPLYFLLRRKITNPVKLTFITVAVGIALTIRLAMLDHASSDYSYFLSGWVSRLKDAPGISGWAMPIGDYNMPYMYLLTFVAKLPSVPLYGIKLISIAADLLLAYYVMQISSLKFKSINSQIAVFIAVLFIPTFFMNSAYWAQCDAIYTLFCVAFVYYALKERPNLSMICCAIAFSFKLQTVFILPLVIVFLFTRHIKFKNLPIFPATFIALLVPAILAGKPIIDTVSIYIKQTDNYDRLSLKAPNIYQFFYRYWKEDGVLMESCNVDYEPFMIAGIMLAGAAVLALLYYLWLNRRIINNEVIILSAFLFSMGIPYLLPKMHERYFYLAEAFAIAVFIFNKKRWFVPLAVTYTSFRAYSIFLFSDETVNMKALALINLLIIAISVYDLYKMVEDRKTAVLSKKQITA